MAVHGRTCASGVISISNAAGECRSIVEAYGDLTIDSHSSFGWCLTSSGSGNRVLCNLDYSGAAHAHGRSVGDCIHIPSGAGGAFEGHTIVTIDNTSKFTVANDLTIAVTNNSYKCVMTRNKKMSDFYRVTPTSNWPTRITSGDPVDADIVHPLDEHYSSGSPVANITSGNPISFSNFYCTGGTYCAVMVAGSTAALSIGWARCGSGQSQVVTVNGSYPQGGPLRCIGYICNDKNYGDTYPTDDDENVSRESWGISALGDSPASGNPIGCCVGGPYATHATYCLKNTSFMTAGTYSGSTQLNFKRNINFNFFSGIYPAGTTPTVFFRWYYRHNGANVATSYKSIYMHWDGRNSWTN